MLIVVLLLLTLTLLVSTEVVYEYLYSHKSIVYDKSIYTNSPTNIYTNFAGNVVITGDTLGNMLRSTDHGKNWDISKKLSVDGDYLSISGLVMNEEGDEMLISTKSDTIFYSNDYGLTFTARSKDRQCSIMTGSKDLKSLMCIGGEVLTSATFSGDDDGADVNKNHLYYSKDGGYTWHKSNVGKSKWIGLLSNEDGSWVVGAVSQDREYAWASSDGGKSYKCINNEESNAWGSLAGSKNLQTMILTDRGTKNVHISQDYGYTWTQIYNGANLAASVSINACSVSADSYEYDDNLINLAIGFSGSSMEVVTKCNSHTEHEHCEDQWTETGDSDSDADTYSVALSGDGKYFYSVDSTTMKISIGIRKIHK